MKSMVSTAARSIPAQADRLIYFSTFSFATSCASLAEFLFLFLFFKYLFIYLLWSIFVQAFNYSGGLQGFRGYQLITEKLFCSLLMPC